MALFGEKYGSVVRMVSMGDGDVCVSRELCGGTHVARTSQIGLFKIVYEGSVAAGIRRIEAVTGANVLELIAERDALLADAARELKAANIHDIPKRAAAVNEELRRARHDVEVMNSRLASAKLGEYKNAAVAVGPVRLVAVAADGMDIAAARELGDALKSEMPDVVAVLAVDAGDKLNFVCMCGPDAVKAGAHAGKIVGAVAAVTGGKGGGRPDSAVAGGKDASRVAVALGAAAGIVESFVK